MRVSARSPRRDDGAFHAALAGLAPFIIDDGIDWRAFCAVAESVGASKSVRERLETLIAEAGMELRGRPAPEGRSGLDPEPEPAIGADVDPIVAARRVIGADRWRVHPEKVVLTASEEVGLALLLRGDEGHALEAGEFGSLAGERGAAALCLFLHNQGLVHSVAQKYAPPGMTHEDLFQHGALGLIRAVELFDPAQGTKFSTYATYWVRQAITRGIANESRIIRLPVYMVERVNEVWATRDRLTVDGVLPYVRELAGACELTEAQVRECLKLGRPQDGFVSLDRPVGDGEATLGDLLGLVDERRSPEDEIDFAFLRAELRSMLTTLTEREAGVISMRFGLHAGDPMTLEEIGSVYRVTRERIRQIEKRAMERLRESDACDAIRVYV